MLSSSAPHEPVYTFRKRADGAFVLVSSFNMNSHMETEGVAIDGRGHLLVVINLDLTGAIIVDYVCERWQ